MKMLSRIRGSSSMFSNLATAVLRLLPLSPSSPACPSSDSVPAEPIGASMLGEFVDTTPPPLVTRLRGRYPKTLQVASVHSNNPRLRGQKVSALQGSSPLRVVTPHSRVSKGLPSPRRSPQSTPTIQDSPTSTTANSERSSPILNGKCSHVKLTAPTTDIPKPTVPLLTPPITPSLSSQSKSKEKTNGRNTATAQRTNVRRKHKCAHLAHPAYTNTDEECPSCLLKDAIHSLQQTVSEITSHGGWTAWRSTVETYGDYQACRGFRQATFGYDKGKTRKDLERKGWRNKRTALAQLVDKLERWVEIEKVWQREHKDAGSVHEETNWAKTTAEAALKVYEELQTSATVNGVQDAEAQVFHKRAREEEHETIVAWGDSPIGRIESGMQHAADGPANAGGPPKRKRRCVEGVSFHLEVFIRADSDIDTLRKSSTFSSTPHKTSSPPSSILRTRTAAQAPTAALPKQILPALELPQSVQALNEAPSRPKRYYCRKNAGRRCAFPGQWAVREGYEIINTSFDARKRENDSMWIEREEYYRGLEEEGKEWDVLEGLEVALNKKAFPSVKVARMSMGM